MSKIDSNGEMEVVRLIEASERCGTGDETLRAEDLMTKGQMEISQEGMHLLSVVEAASRLGISHWTLRKHIARQNVEATRIGNRVLIRPAEIARITRTGLPCVTQDRKGDRADV
jgi:excisionase family DNA binding protein